MSLINQRVFTHHDFRQLDADAPRWEKQRVVDKITDEILDNMAPELIAGHVKETFNSAELVQNHTDYIYDRDIPTHLLDFMETMPDGGRILEPGCGSGRDSLFMACNGTEFRKYFMRGNGRIRMYDIPEKTFRVIGIDNSAEMTRWAKSGHEAIVKRSGLPKKNPNFFIKDWRDMKNFLSEPLDGIWSWLSLGCYTPFEFLDREIETMAGLLKPGGKLFMHYFNGGVLGGYDRLVMCGNLVQFFSQPSPHHIVEAAEAAGLKLIRREYSDQEDDDGRKIRNVGVYHTFEKL